MISREQLQRAAQAVHNTLPNGNGFIILVAPFGDGTGTTDAIYASNCNREDAIKILKTMLFRWGINEEWMKTIE